MCQVKFLLHVTSINYRNCFSSNYIQVNRTIPCDGRIVVNHGLVDQFSYQDVTPSFDDSTKSKDTYTLLLLLLWWGFSLLFVTTLVASLNRLVMCIFYLK